MPRPTMMEQLTSLSEDALERLAQSPVTRTAVEAGMQVKSRVEKLVASFADLDGRVTRIEERLDALEGKPKPAAKPRKPRAAAAKPAEHEHEPEHEPEPEHQPEAHAEPEPARDEG
jgi:hypothetical protein